jgi:hypothetical protein
VLVLVLLIPVLRPSSSALPLDIVNNNAVEVCHFAARICHFFSA